MNFILVINLLYAQYNLCQSVLANNEFTTVFFICFKWLCYKCKLYYPPFKALKLDYICNAAFFLLKIILRPLF